MPHMTSACASRNPTELCLILQFVTKAIDIIIFWLLIFFPLGTKLLRVSLLDRKCFCYYNNSYVWI